MNDASGRVAATSHQVIFKSLYLIFLAFSTGSFDLQKNMCQKFQK
jgi:hypothetical protein